MSQNTRVAKNRASGNARRRDGGRTQVACVNCKERKLKCDDQVPACDHCRRFALVCLVEDPFTKRHQPRNYIETLEYRVSILESILKETRPDLAEDHLFQDDSHHQEAQTSPILPGTGNHSGGDLSLPRIRNEEDGLDDLASQVGILSISAAGAEPHYLGSSSAFAFARLISASLRQVVLRKDTTDSTCQAQDDSTMPPAPCTMPDYDTARKLSNAYFENIHSQYPFLHEPTFRRWEGALNNTSEAPTISTFDPIPFFFLNIVYAVGALILPGTGYSAERLYISAQIYIDYILQRENLETIQAILGCAVYSLRSSTGTSHWKLAGLALRQCIDLGYHRNPRRLRMVETQLRSDLRKRVFWCAYAMECKAAIMLGRPISIPYQEIDAEFPMDIDDSCISEYGICGTPRTVPSDPPTNMTRALQSFRVRRIWAKIHSNLYSDICSPGPVVRDQHIGELRSEIEDWRASIPPLKPPSGKALSLFMTTDSFDMDYNYSILQLYRIQIIDRKNGATDATFLTCLQAAENTCRSYRRQFSNRPTAYTWDALHELFLAGLTYLHCLWTSAAARAETPQNVVSNTCIDCTIVLVMIAERWASAAPYRDIFEALSRHTLYMLGENNLQQAPLPGRFPPPDIGNGDLSQWISCIANTGVYGTYDGLLTSWMGDLLDGEDICDLGSDANNNADVCYLD